MEDEPDPMFITPAAALRLEEGVGMLNDWFSYDQNIPISDFNKPRLYVAESCVNTIWCLREWTGLDGEKGASKDPIDSLRYLAVMQPEAATDESYKAKFGGSY